MKKFKTFTKAIQISKHKYLYKDDREIFSATKLLTVTKSKISNFNT